MSIEGYPVIVMCEKSHEVLESVDRDSERFQGGGSRSALHTYIIQSSRHTPC